MSDTISEWELEEKKQIWISNHMITLSIVNKRKVIEHFMENRRRPKKCLPMIRQQKVRGNVSNVHDKYMIKKREKKKRKQTHLRSYR